MNFIVGTYGPQAWKLSLDDNFGVVGASSLPVANASYLCLSDCGQYVFAITESGDDSWLTSFSVEDPSDPISCIKCEAPDPCYIVYRQGLLYTADYSQGSISVYRTSSGKIEGLVQRVCFDCRGIHPRKQLSSHVHMLKIHGGTMYATDLGGDRVHILSVLPDGRLEHKDDIVMRQGCGPRHLDVSRDGRFVYVLTEMSKELYVFDNLRPVQALILGDTSFEKQNGGDIHLHPGGMYLYVSLRDGGDSIVSFYIKPQSGTLTRRQTVPTGAHPRNFAILPEDGLMAVFCKDERRIRFYDLDARTGLLSESCRKVALPSDEESPVFGVKL